MTRDLISRADAIAYIERVIVIGKRYGCCDKLKNCAKCCRENGWEDWERSNNE